MNIVIISSVIIKLILVILSKGQAYKIRGGIDDPEIWLSSFSETDSFEHTTADSEFRQLSQFQNDLISKNGSDYVVQDDTIYAVFVCQAKYPVMWTIPHLKHVEFIPFFMFQTHNMRTSEIKRNENLGDVHPKSKKFQTFLTVHFSYVQDFLSVNLTCVEPPSEGENEPIRKSSTSSSSIYLFYMGKNLIENKGSTLQVYVSPTKQDDDSIAGSELILPCRPATPNITIVLEKQITHKKNRDKTSTTKLIRFKHPTNYVRFDPKVGFILNKDPMGKRKMIFGMYRCTAFEDMDNTDGEQQDENVQNNNNQQFIFINVTSDPLLAPSKIEDVRFQAKLNLKSGATVSYSNQTFGNRSSSLSSILIPRHDEAVLCCSGVIDKSPRVYVETCFGHLQCQILKWDMTLKIEMNELPSYHYYYESPTIAKDPNDCARTYLPQSPVVFCKGENVQFANHFVNLFTEGLLPISNRSQVRQENGGDIQYLSTYENEFNAKKAEISRKMFLTFGHLIPAVQVVEDNNPSYYRIAFQGLELSQDLVSGFEYIDDWTLMEAPTEILEYSRDNFYEGEPIIAICLGWSLMYSRGAHVTINFSNGTRGMVISEKIDKETKIVYFSEGIRVQNHHVQRKEILYRLGKEVLAHRDMVSVDCWMPQWDTGNWDKITRNLTILEAIPPKFGGDGKENAEETTVYFYLGEESKELECQVVEGAPEPMINVTMSGEGILKERDVGFYPFHSHEEDKRNSYESLFNVSLERGNNNGTTVEDNNGTNAIGGVTVVKIRFTQKVIHEMQGVYQCTAENVGGKVKRTFRVIVAAKRNVLLPIVLATTIVSSLLLMGMGIRHWWQQKQMDLLRSRT